MLGGQTGGGGGGLAHHGTAWYERKRPHGGLFLAGLVALDETVGQAGRREWCAAKLAGGLPGLPFGQRKHLDGGLPATQIL